MDYFFILLMFNRIMFFIISRMVYFVIDLIVLAKFIYFNLTMVSLNSNLNSIFILKETFIIAENYF
jgi:hypothetical protein